MAENFLLLSTAYFPPVYYISLLSKVPKAFIENQENYIKQTFRNRCQILTANGPSSLTVPVLLDKNTKTRINNVRIDYSKRWQQVHLRAFTSSYKSSAYFDYYYEDFEKIITRKPEFLIDLNRTGLEAITRITGIGTEIIYTSDFESVTGNENDFRYLISPKKEKPGLYSSKDYFQVFNNKYGFTPGLSILDLIFNMGPDSISFL